MAYFIDVEGFQHGKNGKFLIKELCILSADEPLSPYYKIFTPSKPWCQMKDDDAAKKSTYRYQTNMVHHLKWDEGWHKYCNNCVWREIKKSFPNWRNGMFYVLGESKLKILKSEFPKLKLVPYNATLSTLPAIGSHIRCMYRDHSVDHCACLKCYKLYKHYTTFV